MGKQSCTACGKEVRIPNDWENFQCECGELNDIFKVTTRKQAKDFISKLYNSEIMFCDLEQFVDKMFDEFEQKEAAYRNSCQIKLSTARLASDGEIKSILDHYIDDPDIKEAMMSDLGDAIGA